MQITIELTDEQLAELDELSAIKQLSRELLAAYAVQDYLDEVRLPRINLDHESLRGWLKQLDKRDREEGLARKSA